MKYKYLIFICLITFGFAACKKEDSYPKKIVGNWSPGDTRRQLVKNGVTTYDSTFVFSEPAYIYLTFNSDGSGKYSQRIPFNYKIVNNKLMLERLIDNAYMERDTFTIAKISDAEMILHWDVPFEGQRFVEDRHYNRFK
ncbi:hypothetical protein FFF34_009425 [Inquilinus sp. KBS0705]|nr:hypothetical protein FFF34_009425 [Inquilinus sp. KBS0705]